MKSAPLAISSWLGVHLPELTTMIVAASAAHVVRQREPVHRAGHLNVRKDNPDFRVRFEDCYGLGGIGCFKRLVARCLKRLG